MPSGEAARKGGNVSAGDRERSGNEGPACSRAADARRAERASISKRRSRAQPPDDGSGLPEC